MPRGISTKVQGPGDKVTARGTEYEIVRVDDADNGSKNFVLKDGSGGKFKATGKRVQHNTLVTPA